MTQRLQSAREAVQSASELTDNGNVMEQLHSIDQALGRLSSDDAPDDYREEGDRLEEIERQLAELIDSTDGIVREHLQTARDHIDQFRQEFAQDWE